MLHPFLAEIWMAEHNEDLTNLSIDKIHEKISELNKRMVYAQGTGNTQMINQLRMLANELYDLANDRLRKEMERQEKERALKMEKARKDFEIKG
jgi:hypothetical protein